jgi:NTP pyrophosphatase (non-canonical NTP hydrolase)
MTTMNEYQDATDSTAIYRQRIPDSAGRLSYAAMGLAGESGEVANEAKRVLSKDGGLLDPVRADRMVEELGDVLWYAAAMARELGVTLEQVAADNLAKLAHRHGRPNAATPDVRG